MEWDGWLYNCCTKKSIILFWYTLLVCTISVEQSLMMAGIRSYPEVHRQVFLVIHLRVKIYNYEKVYDR